MVLAGRAHASNPTADGEEPTAEKLLGTRFSGAHDCAKGSKGSNSDLHQDSAAAVSGVRDAATRSARLIAETTARSDAVTML